MRSDSRKFTLLVGLVAFLLGLLFSMVLQKASASQFIAAISAPVASDVASKLLLAQPSAPDVVELDRKTLFYSSGSAAGREKDLALLRQFSDADFQAYRSEQLSTRWQPEFGGVNRYLASVAPNRTRLKRYLGELHPTNRGRVISKKEINLPPGHCALELNVSHVVIQSRFQKLTFEAYILDPLLIEQNGWSVVALHGHDSSPERMIGLEAEDYTRQMALRLACKGFVVIVPAVTSNAGVNNAISGYAHLYQSRTLYGIMVEFVQSSLDVLELQYPSYQTGLSGISNGALLSLMTSAIDDRPQFVVAEGILGTFWETHIQADISDSDRKDYFYYFQGPFWMEFDVAELSYLSIPRILIFSVGELDSVTAGWEVAWAKINRAYTRLGLEQRVGLVKFHGQHELAENYAIDLLSEKLSK